MCLMGYGVAYILGGLHLQGGIHPEFTGETYLEILRAVKKVLPDIHVHAFSPLEVFQGANTLGIRYVGLLPL